MKLTAIAIDDEPLALQIIKTYSEAVDYLDLKHTFTETNAALKYLNENPVGLLFMDINMPALSGIEFYKMIEKEVMVIFTTAHTEYAVEGFNLNAVDYLLKPFSLKRFKIAVEKARQQQAYAQHKVSSSRQDLYVRADYSMVKVDIAEIAYIEGLDNYIKIHYSNGRHLLVRMSMKAISEKLPSNEFLRVHRSFIVPLAKVTAVRNKTIYLPNAEIHIGTNYVDEVMRLFKESK